MTFPQWCCQQCGAEEGERHRKGCPADNGLTHKASDAGVPCCGCLPGDHGMTQAERRAELRRLRARDKAIERRVKR